MLKDFLKELFGIVFHGLTFERYFFIALALVGGIVIWRAMAAKKKLDAVGDEVDKAKSDLTFRYIIGGGLIAFGTLYGAQAWFKPEYQLFFKEPLVLHTYGVAIACGFVAAIWLAIREARRVGLEPARIMDLAFWFLVSGLIGARVVFMIVEWEDYYNMCFAPELMNLSEPNCLAVFEFWKGGLVFYGGMIGAFVAGVIYFWKYKLPAFRYIDTAAPSIAVGQFFGRLGCVSAGCCHGKYVHSDKMVALEWPTDTAAYGVLLDKPEAAAERAMFLAEGFVTAHPTQLYESGAMLLMLLFLLWLRTRKSFNGQVFLTYVIGYALIRSFIEIFRGDSLRGFVFEYKNEAISMALGLPVDDPLLLSTSQFISIVAACGGIAVYIWRKKVSEQNKEEVLKRAFVQSTS